MKKNHILLLAMMSASFSSAQALASFNITTNASIVEISGSANDFVTSETGGYQDGATYPLTALPLQITQDDLFEGETFISTASAESYAGMDLNIAQTINGYSITGNATSNAVTEINSLDDNDATAMGNAIVDLAFTLTSDYNYVFTTDVFDALGTGESEAELFNSAGDSIFSQIVSDDSLDLSFAGVLVAGDYTFFMGALSEAIDGDFASADLGYDLQLTAVPVPAALPLFLSGLFALGFKGRQNRKA